MPLVPDGSHGYPAAIGAVRVTADGSVRALVESGGCLVPSRLDVHESTTTVELSAFTRSINDGPCLANVVPVFVAVGLEGSLGDRQVVDGSTGGVVRVVRCADDPRAPLCGAASAFG